MNGRKKKGPASGRKKSRPASARRTKTRRAAARKTGSRRPVSRRKTAATVNVKNVAPRAQEGSVEVFGNEWRECLPLTEQQLSEVEKQLNIAIPADLRKLVLSCNGGHPENTYFESKQIMVEIGDLLPIRPPKNFKRRSFEDTYVGLKSKSGLPPSLIPFAYDNGHAGFFCIEVKSGKIVYFVHDEPENPVKEVAGSLNEFLSNLAVPPY